MNRYICIHGHFYQPPRESAWLEAVETQDSAAPFHDWNERITAECYASNASARILDDQGRIAQIVNNYARISFNIGPTLLSWMEHAAPTVYQKVLDADRESQERFGGHGSAMAQAYHHSILPLANSRDKKTEIRWGVADFRQRFGRDPEGMWLPEAAVDLETLELLAAEGLKFAVLAPYQARCIRKLGTQEWTDAHDGQIDTTRVYLQKLPSGQSIALYFYDGTVSRAVAFERLLHRGEDLVDRLIGAFSESKTPQLVHIATDGETYGHHHRFGEMALAYALQHIETHSLARLTNYAEFLALQPPEYEVQIAEQTSWSCFHGVERWRSDCGCNSSSQVGWNQAWRAPLRSALEWLRDETATAFAQVAAQVFHDPWAARDEYIRVVIDRSNDSIEGFLARHTVAGKKVDRVLALRLMELQRYSLMMFTSCGWFFSEISGIETVQVLQYAGRVIQLAQQLFGVDFEPTLLLHLAKAPSNLVEQHNGALIYERQVRPVVIDMVHVAAHYALTSLFDGQAGRNALYCYRVEQRDQRLLVSGRTRLVLGKLIVTSQITGEQLSLTYGALHLGAQTLLGGVRPNGDDARFDTLVRAGIAAFQRADLADVIHLLSEYYGRLEYSLRSVFRDQQRTILAALMVGTLAEVEEAYHDLYTQHVSLMRFLADVGVPLPAEFQVAAVFTLSAALRRAVEVDEPHAEVIAALIEEARQAGVQFTTSEAALAMRRTLDRLAFTFAEAPTDQRRLQRFAHAAAVSRTLPFDVNIWAAQNVYYDVHAQTMPEMQSRAQRGDSRARRWIEQFQLLGEQLRFRVGS